MDIRIVSDGDQTRVYDLSQPEEEQDITRFVHAIEWRHDAKGPATCRVTFVAAALNYVGEARAATQAIVDDRGNLAGDKVG